MSCVACVDVNSAQCQVDPALVVFMIWRTSNPSTGHSTPMAARPGPGRPTQCAPCSQISRHATIVPGSFAHLAYTRGRCVVPSHLCLYMKHTARTPRPCDHVVTVVTSRLIPSKLHLHVICRQASAVLKGETAQRQRQELTVLLALRTCQWWVYPATEVTSVS